VLDEAAIARKKAANQDNSIMAQFRAPSLGANQKDPFVLI